ncbi:TetR/AcrR family transcriptional regulator [Gloeobacter kilaueensis]|uniref:TetR/AcrR family transcriptional regulator n=1 Tax=Gloeobacter kilaueensis TaxID=1416614 RepID=UPI00041B2341|nr:TetR/AcrR family transcriptional regulator [Gloeobacter kilaueensis]
MQSPSPVRGPAKREQILRGALAVFAEHGYAGTSMDRVASGARVSKPTLYSHFQSKEKLFLSVCGWVNTQHLRWSPPPSPVCSADLSGWLKRQLSQWLAAARRPENVFVLRSALSESLRFPELGELYTRAVLDPLYDWLLETFDAQPSLATSDRTALADYLCAGLLTLTVFTEIMHGLERLAIPCEQWIASMVDLVLGQPQTVPLLPPAEKPAAFEVPPQPGPEAADRREQLLQEAMAVFLAHGYAGTSMDMVAQATGVSKPTLYTYFQDKEGLFSELIARVTIRRSILPLQPMLATLPPPVLLKRQATAILAKADDQEYVALLRLVLSESVRFPELIRLYVGTVAEPGHRYLSRYLMACRWHRFPPEMGALLLIGPIIGLVLLQSLLHSKVLSSVERERFVDCVVGLLVGSADP